MPSCGCSCGCGHCVDTLTSGHRICSSRWLSDVLNSVSRCLSVRCFNPSDYSIYCSAYRGSLVGVGSNTALLTEVYIYSSASCTKLSTSDTNSKTTVIGTLAHGVIIISANGFI